MVCFNETGNNMVGDTDQSTDIDTENDMDERDDIDTDELSPADEKIAAEQRRDCGWNPIIEVLDGTNTKPSSKLKRKSKIILSHQSTTP